MTSLMKKFIERLQEIPEEEQDKYAATYLQELEDDQRWEELFARTTEEQWKKLVEKAREDVKEGESVPLDEFLNTQRS
jgi:methylase of polypeptide subunit release factors